MLSPTPPDRRPLSRRLATRGAVFCTFFGTLEGFAAPAPTGGPARPRPLVMIDPGHGGRDPGARGLGGTLEKDVTLSTALALKHSLEARGRYQVGLTRAADRFMTPEDRVDMARDQMARAQGTGQEAGQGGMSQGVGRGMGQGTGLFLSLHADTYPVASVRGASVYTLARHASDPETEALAARENAAGSSGRPGGGIAPAVSDILSSLARRETRATSSRIARHLVRDLERDVPVLPSPARHANFMVLQTSGVPSVLIEMGFLSNRADEAALNDATHQMLIAHAMTRAIDAWFAPVRPHEPG